jgi:hypothetical protein
MKKTLLALLSSAISLFAQTGISKNAEGIRVPSAFTLKQGLIYGAFGLETVSDGEPLSLGGYYTNESGEKTSIGHNAASSTFSGFVSYGALDYLEIGLYFPVHYDGDVNGTKLGGTALGDLQFYIKGSIPTAIPVQIGGSLELYAPTGSKSIGFRPRHVWYIRGDDESHAYTADSWSMAATLYASLYKFRLVHWNNFIGFHKSMSNKDITMLWGTGLYALPEKMLSLSLELSGETRLTSKEIPTAPIYDPLRFTPGLRLHLPGEADLAIGADIGLGFVKKIENKHALPVTRESDGQTIKYHVAGQPKTGISFSLSKTFDFSWKDSDHDGIIDRQDLCPESALGVAVNQRGCPVDQDRDGILNIVDDCPNTPTGVYVDYRGCPIDSDEDGVPDYLDMCDNTPEGTAVNKKGCTLDSDGDGVHDNADKCPKSIPGERVDSEGCPLDEDHDGVFNENDQCPETRQGLVVDLSGCPLDFDHDGIPDSEDNCPNSVEGELINEHGCPLDTDQDGVPDSKDKCPETPNGMLVGINGCPSDRDRDGVPDYLDKCPNTQPNIPVDSTGCNRDSDQDNVPDYLDKCPGTFPGIKVDGTGCPTNSKYSLEAISKRVLFISDKGLRLANSSYTAINDVIYLMRRFNFKLTVVCSNQAQADNIVNYLESKGFTQDFVTVQIKPGSAVRFLRTPAN